MTIESTEFGIAQGIVDKFENDAGALIRPTMYIGLGGSGRKVLMRLRRLLFEQYKTKSLPFTEFFCFDTDAGDGLKDVEPWLMNQIQLEDSEQLIRQLSPTVMAQQYYPNIQAYPHIFYRNQQETPNGWFDFENLKGLNLGAVQAGCGQIRSFGRLAFYHHFFEIKQRLEEKSRRMTRGTMANEALQEPFNFRNLDVKQKEVVIISSLAGGTGSGCLLDFAYLAQTLFPDAMVTGIFFLPGVFADNQALNTDEVLANGYATLRELEYYSSPQVLKRNNQKFTFHWNGQPQDVHGAPFQAVYLLDDRSMAGLTYGPDDVFQMTAEYLSLQLDKGQFGQQRRSDRSNMMPLVTDHPYRHRVGGAGVSYVENLPVHYFTFGLAQIRLDQARTANAAANRLCMSMIDWWLRENRTDADFTAHGLPNLITELRLRWENLRNDVVGVVSLERLDTTMNERVAHLNGRIKAICDEFRQNPDRPLEKMEQAMAPFGAEMEGFMREVRLAVEQNLLPNARQFGDQSVMQQRATEISEEISRNLQAKVLEYLSDPSRFGLFYAQDTLQALAERVEHAVIEVGIRRQKLEEELSAFEGSIHLPSPNVERMAKLRRLVAQAHGLSSAAPLAFVSKRWTIDLLSERLRRSRQQLISQLNEAVNTLVANKRKALHTYATQRYELEALKLLANPESTGILNSLLRFMRDAAVTNLADNDQGVAVRLLGLQHGLSRYQDRLTALRGHFETRFRAFSSTDKSQGRNILLSAQVDYHSELMGIMRQKYRTTDLGAFEALTADFFRDYHMIGESRLEGQHLAMAQEGVKQLFERALGGSEAAWRDVITNMEGFAHSQTRDFRRGDKVWDAFCQQFPDSTLQVTQLEKVITAASPRLGIKFAPAEGNLPAEQRPLIGMPPNSQPVMEAVSQLGLRGQVHYYAAAKNASVPADKIIFATEWGIFPLNNVEGLRKMAAAYDRQTNALDAEDSLARRHTVANREVLPDLLPPDNDDIAMRRLDIFKALVQGVTLGTLNVDSYSGQLFFMEESDALPMRRSIGRSLLAATRRMEKRPDWVSQIQRYNRVALDRLLFDSQRAWDYALVLAYLIQQVFPQETEQNERGNHYHPLFRPLYLDHKKMLEQNEGLTQDEFVAHLTALSNMGRLNEVTHVVPLDGGEIFAPLRAFKA